MQGLIHRAMGKIANFYIVFATPYRRETITGAPSRSIATNPLGNDR